MHAERDYIAKHNPAAAEEVAAYLYKASLRLEALPFNAPESDTRAYRELILTRYRYPYIIRYRIRSERVEILRMIHGRRKRRRRY